MVLKLSETFGLDDVRRKAARNLRDKFFAGDPIKALLCAKENALDDWIEPLIKKIVDEKRNLSEEELESVGISLAMKIAYARGAAGSPIQEVAGPFSNLGLPTGGGKKKGKRGKQ